MLTRTLLRVFAVSSSLSSFFFFFNDTATTEIYTLSLHDALPISRIDCWRSRGTSSRGCARRRTKRRPAAPSRSEEHTSELQSQSNLVCRLLLEKKKKKKKTQEQTYQPLSLSDTTKV